MDPGFYTVKQKQIAGFITTENLSRHCRNQNNSLRKDTKKILFQPFQNLFHFDNSLKQTESASPKNRFVYQAPFGTSGPAESAGQG